MSNSATQQGDIPFKRTLRRNRFGNKSSDTGIFDFNIVEPLANGL